MNLQDQVIYFHRDGKPGYRFMTAKLKRKLREKEEQRRRHAGRKAG